ASHVPPASSSRPPRTRGADARRTVIGTAGRSKRSSRLAPTTKGRSSRTCARTISRHTVAHLHVQGTRLPAYRDRSSMELLARGPDRPIVAEVDAARLQVDQPRG